MSDRVSIIKADNAVGVNGFFYSGLDLSECGCPENLWALQWNEQGGEVGHIEYNGDAQNESIAEFPAWATACVAKWQEAEDARLAAIAAAEAAKSSTP